MTSLRFVCRFKEPSIPVASGIVNHSLIVLLIESHRRYAKQPVINAYSCCLPSAPWRKVQKPSSIQIKRSQSLIKTAITQHLAAHMQLNNRAAHGPRQPFSTVHNYQFLAQKNRAKNSFRTLPPLPQKSMGVRKSCRLK